MSMLIMLLECQYSQETPFVKRVILSFIREIKFAEKPDRLLKKGEISFKSEIGTHFKINRD